MKRAYASTRVLTDSAEGHLENDACSEKETTALQVVPVYVSEAERFTARRYLLCF